MRARLRVWWRNLPSAHHRVMMRYLRKRGWVVFYLEERYRTCTGGSCWMTLYAAVRRSEDADRNRYRIPNA